MSAIPQKSEADLGLLVGKCQTLEGWAANLILEKIIPKKANQVEQIGWACVGRSKEGAHAPCAPYQSTFSISMQFLVKIMPNNRLAPPLGFATPPPSFGKFWIRHWDEHAAFNVRLKLP